MSDTRTFECASCKSLLRVPNKTVAFKVTCPKCAASLLVPSVDGDAAPITKPSAPIAKVVQPTVRAVITSSKPAAADPLASFPVASPGFLPSPQSSAPYLTPQSQQMPARKSKALIFGLVFGLLGLFMLIGIFALYLFLSTNIDTPKQSRIVAKTPATSPNKNKSTSRTEDSSTTKTSDNAKSKQEMPISTFDMEETLHPSKVIVKTHAFEFRGKSPKAYRVYIPPGKHADGTLPCVIVAPAGTTLLHGSTLSDSAYHKETLPYALAGMMVVFYSLDGALEGPPPRNDQEQISQMARGYKQFRDARGGINNGSAAIDYVLKNYPQVNKNKIFTSGHSSAATVSLLVAANDDRVRACIAFAPVTDLKNRFSTANQADAQIFPGLFKFIDDTNPRSYVDSLKCPVFLFHARDDSNVPFMQSVDFANRLKKAGNDNVKMEIVDRGDHYQPMIDQGLDLAVEWLKGIE